MMTWQLKISTLNITVLKKAGKKLMINTASQVLCLLALIIGKSYMHLVTIPT